VNFIRNPVALANDPENTGAWCPQNKKNGWSEDQPPYP
jgi:hypothetical protein